MDVLSSGNSQPSIDPKQRGAIIRLERVLMAPCCYTQTIDVHASDIAKQMKAEVHSMILAGKSEAEVLGFYKSLYGEQILAVPDGILGELAFAIPITVTALATGTLLFVLRRFHARKLSVSAATPIVASDVSDTVREEIRRQTAW